MTVLASKKQRNVAFNKIAMVVQLHKPSNVACAPGGSYSPAPTGFSMHYRHAYAAKGSVAARVALNVRINER